MTQKIETKFWNGRKNCGKRRKCWLQAFSPFLTKFSKWVDPLQNNLEFAFENTFGNRGGYLLAVYYNYKGNWHHLGCLLQLQRQVASFGLFTKVTKASSIIWAVYYSYKGR